MKAASLQIEMDFIGREAEYKRQSMLKEIAKAEAEQEVMKRLEEEFEQNETIVKHQDDDMEAYFEASKHRGMNITEPVQPTHIERDNIDPDLSINKVTPVEKFVQQRETSK